MIAPDIILVDRDPHDRGVAQRLGITGTAAAQPIEQPGDIVHLGRLRQILLGLSDAGAQPGEIQQLYTAPDRGPLGGI